MAITAALPRLGYDAVQTIGRMTETGELVTHQPVFCQPRNAWQPITPEQGAELAGRFHVASRASAPVASSLRDLLPSHSPAGPTPTVARHSPTRVREFSRGITR